MSFEFLSYFFQDQFLDSLNGNLTAIFSLLFDNLVNVTSIQTILESNRGADTSTITKHLFVGSLSGVIFGNLIIYFYTIYGNTGFEVCIPFGIDAPTIFFIAYAVRDIYDIKISKGKSSDDALSDAWANGALLIMVIGLVKLFLTSLYVFWDFPSKVNQRIFAGCLAGIGIALLGFNNILDIFLEPLSGLISLFVFLMVTLPDPENMGWRNKIPHFLWSVLIGIPTYYILANIPVWSGAENPDFFVGFPSAKYFFTYRFDSDLQAYVVEAISYGCLVFCGGYSVVKVAMEDDEREAGIAVVEEDGRESIALGTNLLETDSLIKESKSRHTSIVDVNVVRRRNKRNIIAVFLFIDSFGTIIGSLFGGLVQTTPYIGYSTYKKLGAKKDYSWMFAVMLIILTSTGSMSYLAQALPAPVLKPIFVLIALQVAEFAFGVTNVEMNPNNINRYIPALIMAIFPSMAQLMNITGNTSDVVVVLSRGFVITSILWGQVTLSIINGKRMESCQFFCILAVLTFFGFIHSFDGKVYYNVWKHGSYLPTYMSIGYAACAILSLIFVPPKRSRYA